MITQLIQARRSVNTAEKFHTTFIVDLVLKKRIPCQMYMDDYTCMYQYMCAYKHHRLLLGTDDKVPTTGSPL